MELKFKERFENFVDEVNFCGSKEIWRTDFVVIKIFWWIFIGFGALATGYYLANCIKEYNQNPTSTKVEFQMPQVLNYPTVAICPSDWIDLEKVKNFNLSFEAMKSALSHLFSTITKEFMEKDVEQKGKHEFISFLKTKNIVDYRKFFKMISRNEEDVINHDALDANVTKVFLLSQICYLVQFSSIPCTRELSFVLPKFEIFFNEHTKKLKASSTFDLNYILFNPNLKSTFNTNRFVVERGKWYMVKIFPSKFIALSEQLKKPCIDTPGYSQQFCHLDCMQHKYCLKYFECAILGMFNHSLLYDTNMTMCHYGILRRSRDLDEKFLLAGDECSTLCTPSCERVLLDITMSSVNFQTQQFNETSTSVVEMAYEVCNQGLLVIQEYKRYPIENLIADVGGILGLWVGASAVTFIQVVMCLVEMLFIKISKKRAVVSINREENRKN